MSIEKVAKLAGVSTSTVSRVINNHPRVAPETARSVMAAMEQLSYEPSERRPGPKPASRQSAVKTIGFFVVGRSDGASTPGFFDLLRGVSEAISGQRHKLLFAHVPDPHQPPAQLQGQALDGVILHGVRPAGAFLDALMQVPTVWVMGNRKRPEWGDQVMPDTLEVGDLAAGFLAEQGHENLCFVNLDGGHWALASYGHCFLGSAKALGRPACAIDRRHTPDPQQRPGFDPDVVNDLVDELLALDPRPTGLFVADALQSAVLVPVLTGRGVVFGPGETQVITCNNEEAYLVGLSPRPAVIDIAIEAIGQQGVEQLAWRMQRAGLSDRMTTMITPKLILPRVLEGLAAR